MAPNSHRLMGLVSLLVLLVSAPAGADEMPGGSIPIPVPTPRADDVPWDVIEDRILKGMHALDEIAQVEGIDMLFFGPGDYSHALGIPGEFDDPRIADARQQVAQAATRHNKFAGTVGSSTMIEGLVDQGYRFISTGADVVGLGDYFSSLAAAFNSTTTGGTPKGVYR